VLYDKAGYRLFLLMKQIVLQHMTEQLS